MDIKHVTLYAFSTENWNRPVYEVKALMNLFKYYLNKKLTQLHEENVNVSIIGDIDPFPKIIKKYIQNLVDLTKNNNGMYLNLALNYGGRAEIVRATKRIGKKILQKKISLEQIDEEYFAENLDTGKWNHDPDLIIRTAGEKDVYQIFFYGNLPTVNFISQRSHGLIFQRKIWNWLYQITTCEHENLVVYTNKSLKNSL